MGRAPIQCDWQHCEKTAVCNRHTKSAHVMEKAETGNQAVVSQGVEQMEFSYAAGGSVNWDDPSE